MVIRFFALVFLAATATYASGCAAPDAACARFNGFCANLADQCPQGSHAMPGVPCNAQLGGFNCLCCVNLAAPVTTSAAATTTTKPVVYNVVDVTELDCPCTHDGTTCSNETCFPFYAECTEICDDGIDNNCDGDVDESPECVAATPAPTPVPDDDDDDDSSASDSDTSEAVYSSDSDTSAADTSDDSSDSDSHHGHGHGRRHSRHYDDDDDEDMGWFWRLFGNDGSDHDVHLSGIVFLLAAAFLCCCVVLVIVYCVRTGDVDGGIMRDGAPMALSDAAIPLILTSKSNLSPMDSDGHGVMSEMISDDEGATVNKKNT
jgi:hypothetical protein